MSGSERCEEIIRTIDEALHAHGSAAHNSSRPAGSGPSPDGRGTLQHWGLIPKPLVSTS